MPESSMTVLIDKRGVILWYLDPGDLSDIHLQEPAEAHLRAGYLHTRQLGPER